MDAIGSVSDDTSFDGMFIISQSSRGGDTSYWISDNAGLGVNYTMVTSTGDRLVWSS